MLRALTLTDVIAQLQQDSGEDIPFNPTEVINALTADTETLIVGGETLSTSRITNYPVNLIQDVGPIGYWRLDDPTGAATVYDSSPFNTATYPKVPGATPGTVTFQAAGAMPGSYGAVLDGATGYIEITNRASLQQTGDLSIELWFKPTSLAASQALVSKGSTGEYHLLLGTDGSITLSMGPAYSQVVVPVGAVTAGAWFHLVVTRRAIDKTIAAYLNGVSRYSGSYASPPPATTNPVRLGAASGGAASAFFTGTLDEIALYARPLTATQAANHYAWAQAADCGSTPYGVGKYGYSCYPAPGSPAGAVYGDSTTTYGGATYA